MALKDLLAVVDTGDKDNDFLTAALKFAEFHEARLTFLVISALPSADYALTIGAPYMFLHDYTEAVEAKQKRIEERAKQGSVEIRVISDQPAAIFTKAAVQSRYADAVLFGPAEGYEHPPIRREVMESILFASGRPVMVLPHFHTPRSLAHVAIGWNASREATHALRDLTALTAPGGRIDVLVLNGRPTTKGHGSEPGADIALHLARHGFNANVVAVDGFDKSDAEALVAGARQQGAALLALGAYGHSRLREMFLGGVTRDLLAGAPIPLLFAH